MPQFAPGTDVCRTRVLLAAMAEYRVTSVLSDEGWLKEEQGRQSVQQEVEVGGCNHSTIKRHIPIAWSMGGIYQFRSFRDQSDTSSNRGVG